MTDETFDYTGYYTIILTTAASNEKQDFDIIKKIFSDCWQAYITNVIALVSMDDGKVVAIYTYFPYTEHHCALVRPEIVNYFYVANETFQFPLNASLFPSKMKNLHKCPLFVATFPLEPYMILNIAANGSVEMDGIDGNVVDALSREMNFSPNVMCPEKHEARGVIYENGTMTGTMNMVSILSKLLLTTSKTKSSNH